MSGAGGNAGGAAPAGINIIEVVERCLKGEIEPGPGTVAKIRQILATSRNLVDQHYHNKGEPSPYLNLPAKYDPRIPSDLDGGASPMVNGSEATRSPLPARTQAPSALPNVGQTSVSSPLLPPTMARTNTTTSIASNMSSPIQNHASPSVPPNSTTTSNQPQNSTSSSAAGTDAQQVPAHIKDIAIKSYCIVAVPRPSSPNGQPLPAPLLNARTWSDVYLLQQPLKALYFRLTPPGGEKIYNDVLAAVANARINPLTMAQQVTTVRYKKMMEAKASAAAAGSGQANGKSVGAGGKGTDVQNPPSLDMDGTSTGADVKPVVGRQNGTGGPSTGNATVARNSPVPAEASRVTPAPSAQASLTPSGAGRVDVKPTIGNGGVATPARAVPPTTEISKNPSVTMPLPNLSIPPNAARGNAPPSTPSTTNPNQTGPVLPVARPVSTAGTAAPVPASQLTSEDVKRFRSMNEEQLRSLTGDDRSRFITYRNLLAASNAENARKAAAANGNAGGQGGTKGHGGNGTNASGAAGHSTPRSAGGPASIDLTQDVKPSVGIPPTPTQAVARPPVQPVHRGNINERVQAILKTEGGISAQRVRSLYHDARIQITEAVEESIKSFITNTIAKGTNNTRPPTPPPPPISVRDLANARVQAMVAAENDSVPVSDDVSNFLTDMAEDIYADQISGGVTVHTHLHDHAESNAALHMKDVALYSKHVHGQALAEFGLESGFGILDTSNKRKMESLAPIRAKRVKAVQAARAENGADAKP